MSVTGDRSDSPASHAYSNGHTVNPSHGHQPSTAINTSMSTSPPLQYFNPVPPPYLPGGPRSLPGISVRAFFLGVAMGLCTGIMVMLIYLDIVEESASISDPESSHLAEPLYGIGYLWRIPFFVATLATFHYLEFDMTARYNTIDAKVSSFLLFNNGWAYNVAHCAAMLECAVTWLFHSRYAVYLPSVPSALPSLAWLTSKFESTKLLPSIPTYVPVMLGLVLVIVGQTTRSLAMKTAGTSFNHIVQATKKIDHVLVMHGVYGICRHPSYFGFFWWGLGTQMVLGNSICLVGYGAILWTFFSHRISNEEKHLVQFFGQSYIEYRKQTPVLIPFIS